MSPRGQIGRVASGDKARTAATETPIANPDEIIAYVAGYNAALRAGIVAASLEARAASLLEALGASISRARAIVRCARHQATAAYPEADATQQRALAALMIIDAVRDAVRRQEGAP